MMSKLTCLLLLSCLFLWDSTSALCSLKTLTSAQCSDLEDARYIDTYQLHFLRASSSSKVLTPGNFRNLTSLRHLDLSGGKIENITSGSFAKLGSLQTLNLAENRIKHLEPDAFDGLKQLHSLKLGNNEISQLPVALMSLKQLRLLDLSENHLNCDCASMKLRDALIARGVKILKTYCAEPFPARDSSILKPNTKVICAFESQDREMQGDQPIESNVESSSEKIKENEEDETLKGTEEDSYEDEKDVAQPSDSENSPATASPASSTEASLSLLSASAEVTEKNDPSSPTSRERSTTESNENSLESVSSKTEMVTDGTLESEPSDTVVPDEILKSLEVESPKENEQSDKREDDSSKSSVTASSDNVSSSTESEKTNIIVPVEGSGDTDDDGSGSDHSEMISRVPSIDFNQSREGSEEEADEEEDGNQVSATPKTTTEPLTWWDGALNFGSVISALNPWSPTESTNISTSTAKSAEEDLKEEQFIRVAQTPALESVPPVEQPTVPPKVLMQDEAPRQSSDDSSETSDTSDADGSIALDSKQSKQGMGSYFVLGALLVILTGLIVTAACKGDFCRKKQKRRDVERGTEMKDMQKSLLDQNAAQPKIQVSNGTTLENVPLMNSSAPPEEPKDNQKSYDISPVTNGSSRSNGPISEVNDPVKPPRKSLNQEIEAPLNGLNPPMDDIDGPDSPCLHNGSQDNLDSVSYDDKPPLSPGAQKVKITMQENPDSVPKTPILITRLKGGENLVKTP